MPTRTDHSTVTTPRFDLLQRLIHRKVCFYSFILYILHKINKFKLNSKIMRVYIWVHKRDVINNEITKYYLWRPQMTGHEDYVQISITPDEFARLEDNGGI